jgi:hypothetical protein
MVGVAIHRRDFLLEASATEKTYVVDPGQISPKAEWQSKIHVLGGAAFIMLL